jgi:hypothetical protein
VHDTLGVDALACQVPAVQTRHGSTLERKNIPFAQKTH